MYLIYTVAIRKYIQREITLIYDSYISAYNCQLFFTHLYQKEKDDMIFVE